MNSVLQSLSNIQEFSCYFNTLPSLESKQKQRVYHSRSLKENCDDANVVEELRKVCYINLTKIKLVYFIINEYKINNKIL